MAARKKTSSAKKSSAKSRKKSPAKTAGKSRKSAAKTKGGVATKARKKPATKRRAAKRPTKRQESAAIVRDVVALKDHVLSASAAVIARTVKQSIENSRQYKDSVYKSALMTLTHYIEKEGKTLSAAQKKKLHAARLALDKVFDQKKKR